MNVAEVETRELLAAVRKASEQARSTHETMTAAAAARADAVLVAMDAGLPREQIAETSSTHRNRL